MEKKVALHNLGCKVNAYELEAMEQMLKNAGYEIVPFAPGADIYIINTCTVTNIADRKSRQMLHKAKKMNPQAVVVAAGNAANQRRHYQKRGMEEGAVESIELSVGSNLAGFQMEIWTMVPEIYELSIVSPTGERFPKTVVRPGERQEYVFLFEINRDI